MKKARIIARLDVKGPNVVKGIQFECLRVMGKPKQMAEEYYLQGADELVYLDIVANLYQRENLLNIVNQASDSIFIPFTVGGGVRALEDIRALLRAGADKVAVNTAATKNPQLIREAAEMFGSQCIVVSIEAKKTADGKWEAFTDNGRQSTGLDAVEWAKKAEELGAGEILLTSVDQEGTENGLDHELTKKVSEAVSIPLIVSGGAGSMGDFSRSFKEGKADAVATASLLHYRKYDVEEIKESMQKQGISVRMIGNPLRIEKKNYDGYDIDDYNKFTMRHLRSDILEKRQDTPKAIGQRMNADKDADFGIGVVNYGINNIKSVVKALEKIGEKAKIIDTPEEIKAAKSLILPGVGAFKNGINSLMGKGLAEPLKDSARNGTPLLGICLGMQLLFSESEEFGLHKGLDIIPGRVVSLKNPRDVKVEGYKVPHTGWNSLKKPYGKDDAWKFTLLKNTNPGSDVYFVHSFHAVPEDKKHIIAMAEYGNQEFCVVAKKDNISATQFHPEKSGMVGLSILKSFCEEKKYIKENLKEKMVQV